MNNKFLYKYILFSFFVFGFAFSFSSCDDVNDWGTDASANRLFSPVVFERTSLGATYVELRFSGIPNADKYVLELSEDSLQFTTIVKTIEISKDELIVDTESTSLRYLVKATKLNAQTQYSARMKTVSNNGIPESLWVVLAFKTPGEQILNSVRDITENSALISWEAGADVTHIILMKENGVEEQFQLSAQNISTGEFSLTNLMDNTAYLVRIFNGTQKRGAITFVSSQKVSGEGKRYFLDGTENIVEFLKSVERDENIVLVIPAGVSYNIGGTCDVPLGIKSLTFWGLAGETKASINFTSIKLDDASTSFKLWIHNMEVKGNSAADDYILNDNATRSIPEFKLDNCDVHTFRGVFRARGTLNIGLIHIETSLIHNIGSYGVLSVDANTVIPNNVRIENNTIYDLIGANLLAFKAKPNALLIKNCTFYNAPSSDKYLINFDGKADFIPDGFKIESCLFGSSDVVVKVRATNPKITTQFVFDSYATNDYTINTGYPLSGVLDYEKGSTDLFEDPANGNFKIKDTNFAGENKPGDPRWW